MNYTYIFTFLGLLTPFALLILYAAYSEGRRKKILKLADESAKLANRPLKQKLESPKNRMIKF